MDLTTLTLRAYTAGLQGESETLGDAGGTTNRATLRRCRTREHGVALIKVSHAIEYLVHSRLIKPQVASDDHEALAILLRANVSVYNEGSEIVSPLDRLRHWFRGGSRKNEAANAAG